MAFQRSRASNSTRNRWAREFPSEVETALRLIRQEIQWCLEHPDKNLPRDYQRGFIAGLKQAKFLIEEHEKGKQQQVTKELQEFVGA